MTERQRDYLFKLDKNRALLKERILGNEEVIINSISKDEGNYLEKYDMKFPNVFKQNIKETFINIYNNKKYQCLSDVNIKAFQATLCLFEDLTEISERICKIKEEHTQLENLIHELNKINEYLPSNAYVPFLKESVRNYIICHIPISQVRIFKTKNRAPYMIQFELVRIDEINKEFKSFFGKQSLVNSSMKSGNPFSLNKDFSFQNSEKKGGKSKKKKITNEENSNENNDNSDNEINISRRNYSKEITEKEKLNDSETEESEDTDADIVEDDDYKKQRAYTISKFGEGLNVENYKKRIKKKKKLFKKILDIPSQIFKRKGSIKEGKKNSLSNSESQSQSQSYSAMIVSNHPNSHISENEGFNEEANNQQRIGEQSESYTTSHLAKHYVIDNNEIQTINRKRASTIKLLIESDIKVSQPMTINKIDKHYKKFINETKIILEQEIDEDKYTTITELEKIDKKFTIFSQKESVLKKSFSNSSSKNDDDVSKLKFDPRILRAESNVNNNNQTNTVKNDTTTPNSIANENEQWKFKSRIPSINSGMMQEARKDSGDDNSSGNFTMIEETEQNKENDESSLIKAAKKSKASKDKKEEDKPEEEFPLEEENQIDLNKANQLKQKKRRVNFEQSEIETDIEDVNQIANKETEELSNHIQKDSLKELSLEIKEENYEIFGSAEEEASLRHHSPFGNFSTWRTFKCIIKSGEDLRQEQFASQLINLFNQIFKLEKVDLWVNPYEVISTGKDVGIIECVNHAMSLDSLKKKMNSSNLKEFFVNYFGRHSTIKESIESKNYERAVNNFIRSAAAYCLICYFLQIKDRHNGNILLDDQGHIIHIDFGFMFTIAPGKGIEFEKAPFKLTNEFVQIMGGTSSKYFQKFRKLLWKGFIASVKHAERIIILVEMMLMGHGESLPCFKRKDNVLDEIRERFYPFKKTKPTKADYFKHVDELIGLSIDNWRTKWYDTYQYYFQGIIY